MADELTTKAIPVMLDELDKVEKTGLITEEALEALKAEKLLAQERIENLRRLNREKTISLEEMEEGIKTIQQEIQEKTTALDSDPDILL
jgi:hypothetical protein